MIKQASKPHLKRLKSKNIVIEEVFLKKEGKKELILFHSSDLKKNDKINNCTIIEKVYLHNGKSIYTQSDFQSNIKYTYLYSTELNEVIECPSCGYRGKTKEFVLGCPYCENDFSIEISKKKESIGKMVYKDTTILCLILLILIFLLKLKIINSEMFFMFILFGLIIETMLLFSQIICLMMKKDVWHEFKTISMNINEQRVYNDLILELSNHYYNEHNNDYLDLIDFEILEFTEAAYDKEGKETFIIISYLIRKYYYNEKNNTIETTLNNAKVRLVRNIKQRHKSNAVFASKCKNCGSPIDFNSQKCEYCGCENDSHVGWKIREIINDTK